MRLPVPPLNPELVKRLPYPWPLGIISWQSGNSCTASPEQPQSYMAAKLSCDNPEANWHLNITHNPIHSVKHTETAPGLNKFQKLHSDETQITKCSQRPALDEVPLLSHQSKLGLTFNTSDWKSRTFTDGSCRTPKSQTKFKVQVPTTPDRATLAWLNLMVLV